MLKADNVDLSAYRRQFFEEATKQMDALGHALERLRETQNKDALVQLFRATASLKGMATTMNYTMLTRLAALLNDTAKRLRGGELAPHPSLLLLAQDTLNVMRVLLEDIHGGLRRPSVDVAPLLERWGPFIVHAPSPQTASVSVTPSPVLQARVQLSPRCQLKAVRAMVILAQLRRIGKVLSCQPDEPTLRTGHIQGEFFVMLTTGRSPAEVQAMLESLGDVTQAEVRYLRVP
jgi:two-component system chemotaxis sensor kinase CheA